MLDKELYSELVNEHQVLIDNIVLAINESIKSNNTNTDTPNWKTHNPWENKVLPNMRKTQEHLENASDALSIGNEDDAGRMCGVVGGIGKDIEDFDTSWMDGVSKTNIENQLDIVVELADAISRRR